MGHDTNQSEFPGSITTIIKKEVRCSSCNKLLFIFKTFEQLEAQSINSQKFIIEIRCSRGGCREIQQFTCNYK